MVLTAKVREYRREITKYKLEKAETRRRLVRMKAESSRWERKKLVSRRRSGKRGK